MGFQFGSEPDEQGQLANLSIGAESATSTGANSPFSRTGAAFTEGNRLTARWGAALPAGQHTIIAAAQDGMSTEDGASTTRAINVAVLNLTDMVLIPGTTEVKAVHIIELQAALDHVLAYFGMVGVSWPSIVAGVTDIAASHIQQLRDIVEDIAEVINGYDAVGIGNDVPMPAWTDPVLVLGEDGTVIKAVHINEIRAMILTL